MNLNRYIKNKEGKKEQSHTTSINITETHLQFLKEHNLNMSLITRDAIDELIKKSNWSPKTKKAV